MKTLLFAAFFAYLHVIMSNSRTMADDVSVSDEARIIGGNEISIENVPWQVGLLAFEETKWTHHCGGSIIAPHWVLSAAHCFVTENNVHWIHAGSAHVNLSGSYHEIVEQIPHPRFNMRVGSDDITVVKVKEAFIFDGTREPVPLYTTNEEVPVGSLGTVSGWGLTDDGEFPTILNSVAVPIINMSECRQFIGGLSNNDERFICSGYPEGGKDACIRDSGGPFTVNGRLVGIVSFGRECGQRNSPGVYMNVAHFYDWIMNNTMGNKTDVYERITCLNKTN